MGEIYRCLRCGRFEGELYRLGEFYADERHCPCGHRATKMCTSREEDMKQLFIGSCKQSRTGSDGDSLERALKNVLTSLPPSLRHAEQCSSGPHVTIGGWETKSQGFPLRTTVDLTYGFTGDDEAVARALVEQPRALGHSHCDLRLMRSEPSVDASALCKVQAALDAGKLKVSRRGKLVVV